jgi:transposase
VPAYRLTHDLGVDPKVISRVYQKLRAAVFHVAELEGLASRLSVECELDEAYFG